MTWMRLKAFCDYYGVPVSVMQRAVHSHIANQFARKADPDKTNSPWLIWAEKALELFKMGEI